MKRHITIRAGWVKVDAELNHSPTARDIWSALPITSCIKTWGDEVYFEIPVQVGEEPDARAEVEVGDLGYWPPGSALCVFFGPTPASTGDAPRAASPVNLVGRVLGDATALRAVQSGDAVALEKAS